MQRERRESKPAVIQRLYLEWAAESPAAGPEGSTEEHAILVNADPSAEADLIHRTNNALRVAGYGRNGKPMERISHQDAKRHANTCLSDQDSALVTGTASRLDPVWIVTEVDPDAPDELLLGGALVVVDDGAVYPIGSLSPQHEIDSLLDRLDLNRPRQARAAAALPLILSLHA